ncbi:SDR family NAD(P)-dependent oxidoreductase [Alkalihalobacterium alkalinitrilicum]|uniref:SDR family NAD(P)-dependent oxidoreductase n=1 Tax=Alkalihalobacterium alkalinitrilicum TaxID=427920 RepID=UPI000994CB10|nr:SDR family oxidoreductase [Alkalihalobacterium alkalinitrilicum]
MENFKEKVIVVTGGSRGLGAQMVRDFASKGANVVISSRNQEVCQDLAHEIRENGVNALPIACDVGNLNDIRQLFEKTLQQFGRIDVLINNAGANVTKPATEVTEEDWDMIYDVNIKGLFFCSQEAAKIMIKQNQGKIINISSVGGVKPYKRIAPYTASKAAVIHLTKSLAAEWARNGILVNSIAPGLISTEINKSEMENKKWLEGAIKAIPLRRLGEPKDISSIALYLASDAANYVTGQTFFIDGGTLSE